MGVVLAGVTLTLTIAACGGSGDESATHAAESTTTSTTPTTVRSAPVDPRPEPKLAPPKGPPPKNLIVRNLIEGKGPAAKRGDELTVEYIGIYYDGAHFTNSWKRSKPFEFTLGGGSPFVNPGWEKGIPGMKVGGRRELIIPPKLLYRGGAPPGANKPSNTLVYVIDLVAISP